LRAIARFAQICQLDQQIVAETAKKLIAALEKAGVEFTSESGGGVGVRLRKRRV
jgi:hypothetical protein